MGTQVPKVCASLFAMSHGSAGATVVGATPVAAVVHAAAEHAESVSTLTRIFQGVGQAFAIVGVGVMAVGGIVAIFRMCQLVYYTIAFGHQRGIAVATIRLELGKAILLGLEILVAADVVETLAKPLEQITITEAGVLGIIVVVR